MGTWGGARVVYERALEALGEDGRTGGVVGGVLLRSTLQMEEIERPGRSSSEPLLTEPLG